MRSLEMLQGPSSPCAQVITALLTPSWAWASVLLSFSRAKALVLNALQSLVKFRLGGAGWEMVSINLDDHKRQRNEHGSAGFAAPEAREPRLGSAISHPCPIQTGGPGGASHEY